MSRVSELLAELSSLLSSSETMEKHCQCTVQNGGQPASITLERRAYFQAPDNSAIELAPGEYQIAVLPPDGRFFHFRKRWAALVRNRLANLASIPCLVANDAQRAGWRGAEHHGPVSGRRRFDCPESSDKNIGWRSRRPISFESSRVGSNHEVDPPLAPPGRDR